MRDNIQRFLEIQRNEGTVNALNSTLGYLRHITPSIKNEIEQRRYEARHPPQFIFEDDWDTLIVLDACRYDLWNDVGKEFTFPKPITHNHAHSPGSTSHEWMQENFSDEYEKTMAETAYVTANPFSKNYADESDFALVDEVWQYGWDDEIGIVPPENVTDRAIDIIESSSPSRTIVHYMQPHFPSLRHPELGSRVDPEKNTWINGSIWKKLRNDEITEEAVWSAYSDNLRDVLNSVEVLLTNHDASKVVITSDHGNGMGENGIYSHPGGRANRVLRKVPYCETKATNDGDYTPELENDTNTDIADGEAKDRLKALGYINSE
jgi:hypothetical protein